jgi:hypothetical protein
MQRAPWEWDELSTPRQLLNQLAEQASVDLRNVESVPHDLWPAVALPPLPLIDRFTLVLAGFDLTLELDSGAQSARIVSSPGTAVLERRYPAGRLATAQLELLREQFPRAAIRRQGTFLIVAGLYEDHLAIAQQLRGKPPDAGRSRPTEVRYHIEVKNKPASAVIREIAASASLEVVISRDAEAAFQNLVSFTAKDATLHQLLEAALAPAGLQFQVDGQRLLITRR